MHKEKATDSVSGLQQPVPSCNNMWGGFPCTDASWLSNSARTAASRSCVAAGSLRTGSVFRGICDYVRKHGAELMALGLENVTSLAASPKKDGQVIGPSNLAVCVYLLLHTCHMVTFVVEMNPRLFGVPQNRPRLYMSAFPTHILVALGLGEASARLIFQDVVDLVVGSQDIDLNRYLCNEDDPAVLKEGSEARGALLARQGKLSSASVILGGVLVDEPPAPRKKRKSEGQSSSRKCTLPTMIHGLPKSSLRLVVGAFAGILQEVLVVCCGPVGRCVGGLQGTLRGPKPTGGLWGGGNGGVGLLGV